MVEGVFFLVDFFNPEWVRRVKFPWIFMNIFWPVSGWGFFFDFRLFLGLAFTATLGIFGGVGGSGLLFLFGVAVLERGGNLILGVVGVLLVVDFLGLGVQIWSLLTSSTCLGAAGVVFWAGFVDFSVFLPNEVIFAGSIVPPAPGVQGL